MKVELLVTVEKDRTKIWDMYVPAMKPHIERILGWEIEWQTNESDTHFYKLNTSFLVSGENKLGYVQYSFHENATYINMIILKPAYQGIFPGNVVLSLIRSLQPTKPLRLRCFHINERALKFYKDKGFTTVESEDDFVLLERHT